ncbi:hypothetical protein [Actinomadura bangladeshensis]|uniref:C2H2-type domain-containing protein n=1 Tax=Actinomadura bangladeshensis TaxID=453573 RepID=A0A4R4MV36_9ACTN|nr:hypothetical protein [Actinomadura bangladeshensis]TDC00049.1 hypothetical protein E1284_40895 [Actinomadura bangladeshensis]
MGRVQTTGSGLEEWACPSCGRRILLRWPPHYVKHVLDHGDEEACHIARSTDDTHRWLRETGATALHTPASGLNPAEPV